VIKKALASREEESQRKKKNDPKGCTTNSNFDRVQKSKASSSRRAGSSRETEHIRGRESCHLGMGRTATALAIRGAFKR